MATYIEYLRDGKDAELHIQKGISEIELSGIFMALLNYVKEEQLNIEDIIENLLDEVEDPCELMNLIAKTISLLTQRFELDELGMDESVMDPSRLN